MKFYRVLFIAIAMSVLLASCTKKQEQPADGRLEIVTTTGMIADLARQIGGEHVRVTALMGPGVDPHLYKASAGDVGRMSKARLILYNGLHLEGRMSEVLEKMQNRAVTMAVSTDIPKSMLLESSTIKGHYDPHIWFDLRLWILAAESIGQKLKDLDPEHAEGHWRRTRELTTRMTAAHAWIRALVASIPKEKRILVTSHDAFRYFGKAYGFQVRGLQGISTATEAGTADVRELADFVVSQQLPAIFVESSVPRRTMEAVMAAVESRGHAVKLGGELFSDAMGDAGSLEGTYIGMVKYNVRQIVEALGGRVIPEQSHE